MLTASSTETFVIASKAWLKTVLAHPVLTPATKTVATALYLRFNSEEYKETGKFKAWPKWTTLSADCALTEEAIRTGTNQLEHYQLLEIKRGRYDRAAQRRAHNEYFARFPSLQPVNCAPYQGADSAPNPTPEFLGKPTPANWGVIGDSSPILIGEHRLILSSSGTVKTGDKFVVPWSTSSEVVRSTEAAPPEAANGPSAGSGHPSGPSARSEVQPRKVTGELEASLNRMAARNGGGR